MAPETVTNFTYNDLLEMPDDGRQYEIIDGELLVVPSPIPRHQLISSRLEYAILNYLEAHPIGIMFHAPMDVVFTQRWVLQPDILYIRNERRSVITKTNIGGAPDLTIEVLSESTRKKDEITKRKAYEQFGVGEYWIVDPVLESIKIYRRDSSGAYSRVADVSNETKDATVSSPFFPGLEIALARVFAE